VLRRAVDHPLQRDSVEVCKLGEMRRGVSRMEIEMNRKNPEKEKSKKGHPRADSDFFYGEQENPKS